MAHELDGIRAKNALCTWCGYHIGGVPIKDAHVRCPECGRPVVFELVTPTPRRGWVGIIVMGVAFAAMIGFVWAGAGPVGGVVMGGCLGVVWLLMRGLRRWADS